MNDQLKSLDSGWMVSIEAQQYMTKEYPYVHQDNLASFLIEKERQESFITEGEHFAGCFYMTFVYLPEIEMRKKAVGFFYDKNTYEQEMEQEIGEFLKVVENMTAVLCQNLMILPLTFQETVQYLHSTCSLTKMEFKLNSSLCLDWYITDDVLQIATTCKLGDYFIPILNINDFPSTTYPAMFNELNKLDVEYRWVTRFFSLSKEEQVSELEKSQRRWNAGRTTSKAYMKELAFSVPSSTENMGAVALQSDVENAQMEVASGYVGLCRYNSSIMVWDENKEEAMRKMKKVRSLIVKLQFSAKEETLNAFEAFLGMTAGNVYANIRRELLTTGNLTHILPLSAVWSGNQINVFTRKRVGIDAPLITCTTDYGNPFFFNLNVNGVMHLVLFGPTGGGKSIFLCMLEVSFLKYGATSQIFILDKGLSALTLTLAVGGEFIEPGKSEQAFQPLALLDTPEDRTWAVEFIELLLSQQGVVIDAEISTAIKCTIDAMATTVSMGERTLTTFAQSCQVIDKEGKDLIQVNMSPYLLTGQYGKIFDGDNYQLKESRWLLIEMGHLMNMGEKAVQPAIMYIFHMLEKRFDGRMTLLVLDEAFIYLQHPTFAPRIKEWLKTLRKLNVSVCFATQEVADTYNCSIRPTIIQNCPTKIYIADPGAENIAEYYTAFGLTTEEIGLLARATMQRDYYYKSSEGSRMFQLDLGMIQLALFQPLSNKYRSFLINQKKKYKITEGLAEPILRHLKVPYKQYLKGEEYESFYEDEEGAD